MKYNHKMIMDYVRNNLIPGYACYINLENYM